MSAAATAHGCYRSKCGPDVFSLSVSSTTDQKLFGLPMLVLPITGAILYYSIQSLTPLFIARQYHRDAAP